MKYFDFYEHNPFRSPSWRLERLLQIADRPDGPMGRCTPRDDSWIRDAKPFVRPYKYGNERQKRDLFLKMPGLFCAWQLYEHTALDPDQSQMLQARILSRQPFEQIAQALFVLPETVEWYEALFFNVTDRIHAVDWIVKQVLVPAFMGHVGRIMGIHPSEQDNDLNTGPDNKFAPVVKPFLDPTLHLFAYAGGPHIINDLILGLQLGGFPQTVAERANWWGTQWSAVMSRRSTQAAVAFRVTKFDVMELLNTQMRLMELIKGDKTREQALGDLERGTLQFLRAMGRTVGTEEDETPGGRRMKEFETSPAELRDDELMDVTSGKDKHEELLLLKIPPAPTKPHLPAGEALPFQQLPKLEAEE